MRLKVAWRHPFVIKVAVAALFWIAVGLIQKLNWGLGTYKALVIFAVAVSVPFLVMAERRWRATSETTTPRWLTIAAIVLLCVQSAYAIKELYRPSLIDAATTTLAAEKDLLAGINPYVMPLDGEARELTQDDRFAGYKYLPLTMAVYLPLGVSLAERGIVLTNLLLHLGIVWLVFRLAAAMAGPSAGWLAILLYLSLPLVPFQLFAKGVTDPVAVLPMLAALLLAERNPALAGLCVGLCLSAKLLPGALLLPCCLPARSSARVHYVAAVILGVLPILPFALWSPTAFFDNIILFNLARPADSTNWLLAAPPAIATAAHLLFAGLYLAVTAYTWWRPPELATRCCLMACLILAAIFVAPVAHHNYQLWWIPLVAALLAAILTSKRLPSATLAVYESGKTAT